MWRSLSAVAVLACLMVPSVSSAQFQQGNWEFTLGGGGANDNDFNNGSFNLNFSLGYFVANELELSVRQSGGYADAGAGSAWSASTRGAIDYHFDLGRWQPFIGANIGYVYGDGVSDTWEAAPEAGVKFFVNSTTFIYGLAEYQFFFNQDDDASESFSDGQFVYTVGIGFKW